MNRLIQLRRTFAPLLAILTISLTGCEVDYDIPEGRTTNTIVVEGLITDAGTDQTVRLTRSTTYNATGPVPTVSGATVTVTPEGGAPVVLPEVEPGLYRVPAATLPGVIGRAYALSVQVGSQTYTASDTLRRVAQLEFVRWVFTNDGGRDDEETAGYLPGLRFQEIPGMGDQYKLRFYRNGQVYRDGPGDYFLIDDRFIDGNVLDLEGDEDFEAWIYQRGDSYAVELQSMTRPAFNFYTDIFSSVVSNNPFASPPYNARGNISGGAYGFFRCTGITSVSGIVP